MNEIYFDNAATTPLSDSVKKEMLNVMDHVYGNPSSLHNVGFQAEQLIKQSTKILCELLRITPQELIYTSGGTESNNTAIFGVASANKTFKRVITATTEHPSVLEPFKQLEKMGYDVIFLPVDGKGHINIAQLSDSINKQTSLVSIMAVNNEIGTIQPIEQIGNAIKRKNSQTIFHVDGVQAFGKHKIDLRKSQIDLFSMSGHKLHAPKGVGGLYIKRRTRMNPLIYGGGQQSGFRSGTENVLGIAAFGVAAQEAFGEMDKHEQTVMQIKQFMIDGLKKSDGVQFNGDADDSPYILNVSFDGIKSEVLLHSLENEGIYVSSGSACSSKAKHSKILTMYGLSAKRAETAIRFSFSRTNSIAEAEYVIKSIEKILPVLARHKI